MNQQTGDPDEASPDSAFNSVRERDGRYSLSDVKWLAGDFTVLGRSSTWSLALEKDFSVQTL